ncbi:hypothetical protein [Actinomadura rudentiformis]|uniref:Uncharacterized protein n=1 Tax=Actinomadura rudentiformis TaxID=359158 RepID=A0A6H9Z0D2_9ACTN|nr:hypothetical protein [Actinomadura rudentiformis]KAB2347321.1 hypothetical protein F8566_20125 [Actinomadura rudentiformis]
MSNVEVIPTPPPGDELRPETASVDNTSLVADDWRPAERDKAWRLATAPDGATPATAPSGTQSADDLDWRPVGYGAGMELLVDVLAERGCDSEHCARHHQRLDMPSRCCCGGDWPGAMVCHPCRNPGHDGADCADGPEPEGGYGGGRWCNCAHKPSSTGLVKTGGEAS